MPPKVKVQKEEIVRAAVEIVRKQGMAALNARTVAAALGCSTQPVFSNFAAMEDLQAQLGAIMNDPAMMQKLMAMAETMGLYTEQAPRALERISGKANCYCALAFDKYEDTLLPGRHVMLHRVSDHGNLGTILRTCLGFGYRDVALCRPCADPFDPHVIRASMGAMFSLRLHVYDSYEQYEESFPDQAPYFFRLQSARPLAGRFRSQSHSSRRSFFPRAKSASQRRFSAFST